jgi:hypothetical protein
MKASGKEIEEVVKNKVAKKVGEINLTQFTILACSD